MESSNLGHVTFQVIKDVVVGVGTDFSGISADTNEPPHDKTNKMSLAPSEVSLGALPFCWFCHEAAQINSVF